MKFIHSIPFKSVPVIVILSKKLWDFNKVWRFKQYDIFIESYYSKVFGKKQTDISNIKNNN